LLREAGLPFEDVDPGRQDFVVASVDGIIVGCVGLEIFGSLGLLRSLAVREPHRGSGLGGALFERVLEVARGKGVQRLFLLTTTAAPFFARRGFVPADRSIVPEGMGQSAQFASLCPSTAACMTMPL
jgi:amino-acid N-acetyltransferase